jgi:predicted LPLAT superfamily acyltransferase
MKKDEENSIHWSQQKEQAAYWHTQILLILFKVFPVIILRILAFPVGFFYFLFSKKGRTESRRFLEKAIPFIKDPVLAEKCRLPFGSLRHIISFSLSLVEKLQSWGGKFPFKDIHFQEDSIGELIQELENKKGAFVIMSHIGNMELLRGLASYNHTGVSREIKVTSIIDTDVTANFKKILNELNPQYVMNTINAKTIDPYTVILLEEKLKAGELTVIAGDRTSVSDTEKNLMLPFFGEQAPFSHGVFYLAALMNVSVYFVFALRRKEFSLAPEYDMHVHKCGISFDCTKKERLLRSRNLAISYVEFLELYCKKHPFQWYNFFNFWSKGV